MRTPDLRTVRWLLLLVYLGQACTSDAPTTPSPPPREVTPPGRDRVDPARWEFCDGVDNDGDGLVDESECPEEYPCLHETSCVCANGYERCGDRCAGPSVPHGLCDGRCTLFHNLPANCGACGHACPVGASCVMGRCVCFVATCHDLCVDLHSDDAHCGACDNACDSNQRCVGGRCECIATCDGRCSNLRDDRANCGACGNACGPAQTCLGGICTCNDRMRHACGPRCTWIGSNEDCAFCGNRCEHGTVCNKRGFYVHCECPPGTGLCTSECTSLGSPLHCGSCSNVCMPGASCEDGDCRCRAPRAICGSACVDTRSSTAHCGDCGHVCAGGMRCLQGACVDWPTVPSEGARLGTRRPTFRWTGGVATVDVCADRACSRVIESLVGSPSPGVTPLRRLDPGVYFWRLRPGDGSASPLVRSFRVDARDVATQGLLPETTDVDGDGRADVVVAEYSALDVYFGGAPLSAAPDAVGISVYPMVIGALAGAGDIDDDGTIDLVLGAAPSDRGSRRFAITYRLADRFYAAGPRVDSGLFAPTGDTNGDGVGDWIWLAAGQATRSPGVPRWEPTSVPSSPVAVDGVAIDLTTVAALGDVDGDGLGDFAHATPGSTPPQVRVVLGSASGFNRAWSLAAASRPYGARVSSAGDVNGDGYADVLASLAGGGAVVFLGGSTGLTLHRTLDDAALVASAGDVDADGFYDLVAISGAGNASLLRGSAGGLVTAPIPLTDPRWHGVAALHSPGDVDGDGFDDVVAGVPTERTAWVFHGAAREALTRAERLQHTPFEMTFGEVVL